MGLVGELDAPSPLESLRLRQGKGLGFGHGVTGREQDAGRAERHGRLANPVQLSAVRQGEPHVIAVRLELRRFEPAGDGRFVRLAGRKPSGAT